jgi:hypothetical protein
VDPRGERAVVGVLAGLSAPVTCAAAALAASKLIVRNCVNCAGVPVVSLRPNRKSIRREWPIVHCFARHPAAPPHACAAASL